MNNQQKTSFRTRSRLLAAVASLAIAGAVGFGAAVSGTAPVLAEAVRVDAPQTPGFADVVDKVSPAVVSVRVKEKIEAASDDGAQMFGDEDGRGFNNLPKDHPLYRFFKNFGGDDRGPGKGKRFGHRDRRGDGPRAMAQGSGFFISEDGYVVTNNHVVEGGQTFTVVTNDGKELDARLIGTDPRTDLAVLKVDGGSQKFTYVTFADDSKVRVGDWVVAVGNPFGLGGTVTAGIVSARGRDIGAGPYDDFIQIDAAVNRGNSGGPAFNLNGEVVGINTAIFSPSGGNVGIAFAIPASTAKAVTQTLMAGKTVERGWLGIQIQPVTQDIADSLGLTGTKGALVSDAQDDGPSRKAGVKAGDVILTVDGQEVTSPKELARLIGSMQPGKSVNVGLWRGGKNETVTIVLGELPNSDKQASAVTQDSPVEPGTLDDMGLTVTRADDGKGLVVTDVDPGSDAADRGIQAGDVITSINSVEVNGTADVQKALADATKAGRKAVLLQISRDNDSRFVALPLGKG
ncbi:MAG: Do family serine endopeptidase [Rhizobiales bacterium]|nr:Do family serine endopeptidase [Hyphomicrobiales bacterium]